MLSTRFVLTTLIVILSIVVVMVKLNEPIPIRIAMSVAMFSLYVSIIAIFKPWLFPFQPVLVGSDVLLATDPRQNSTLSFVLPLQFFNGNFGEGIIEWVAVRLTQVRTNTSNQYRPVLEVDITELVRGKGRLHKENFLEPFMGFVLGTNESIRKNILFVPDPKVEQTSIELESGEYRFTIYLKAAGWSKSRKLLEFQHEFSQGTVDKYQEGTTTYISNPDITLD